MGVCARVPSCATSRRDRWRSSRSQSIGSSIWRQARAACVSGWRQPSNHEFNALPQKSRQFGVEGMLPEVHHSAGLWTMLRLFQNSFQGLLWSSSALQGHQDHSRTEFYRDVDSSARTVHEICDLTNHFFANPARSLLERSFPQPVAVCTRLSSALVGAAAKLA